MKTKTFDIIAKQYDKRLLQIVDNIVNQHALFDDMEVKLFQYTEHALKLEKLKQDIQPIKPTK